MSKMLIIRRKNIIVGLLVVLLIVTGYLNFIVNQNSTPASNPDEQQTSNDGKTSEKDNSAGGGKIIVTDVGKPTGNQDSKPGKTDEFDDTANTAAVAFFRDYRFERKQSRTEEVGYIMSIVDNPNSDEDMVEEAQAQLLELTSNMEAELVIENLIKAKGINDVVVMLHKDSVNVIVDKPELVAEEVAMILDIVKRESSKPTNNIKIIPKI